MRPRRACLVRSLLISGALSAPFSMIGCSFAPPVPDDSDISTDPYAGPPLRLDADAVVFFAPSPGWQIRVDHLLERPARQELFVTLRRPDPAFIYPTVIVEQRAAITSADGASPSVADLALFARILESTELARDQKYAPVQGLAAPTPSTP